MATPFSDDVPGSTERISPRHVLETRIWIRLQRDGKKLSLQGWLRDLSESGLGAFVAEALVLSESVMLEIPLPDCDKQVIPAKVVRALGTEYGFQFTALSAEQRRQIRATLKERPAIPHHDVNSDYTNFEIRALPEGRTAVFQTESLRIVFPNVRG